VLDRLGAADNGGVEDLLVFDFTGDFISFLNKTIDPGTISALWTLAKILEDFFKPCHLMLGFAQMIPKALSQFAVGSLFNHRGQRFHNLLLGVINVLKPMEEQVLH